MECPQVQKIDSDDHDYFDYDPAYMQRCYGRIFPPSYTRDITVTSLSTPTRQQLESLSIPSSAEDHPGWFIVKRGEGDETFHQVVTKSEVTVHALRGLALLRVNKQFNDECGEVLYGENLFSFNANARVKEFTHHPKWIPGLSHKDGTPQTPGQTEYALNRLFAPGSFKPMFVARDPLLSFLTRIGRVNASRMKRIMISGQFMTEDADIRPVNPADTTPGFGRILHAQITVLSLACPALKELTLHRREDNDPDSRWEGDYEAALTDSQHLDLVLADLVERLPSLRTLQLGGPELLQEEFVEGWGTAVKWMKVVDERKRTDADKCKHCKETEAEELEETLEKISKKAVYDVRDAAQFAPRGKKSECECYWCVKSTGGEGGSGRRGGRR